MAEYVYIQKYNKQGIMGISYQVFDKIAEIATNEVSGQRFHVNVIRFLNQYVVRSVVVLLM